MNTFNKIAFLKYNRGLFDATNRERMYWFFREQFRFGHREVLLDYLDLDYSHLIKGFLQHGVHPHPEVGYWPYQELPKSFSTFYPSFVWSDEAVRNAKVLGKNHVRAIGAPWLYLLAKLGLFVDGKIILESERNPSRDVLIVPAHGSGHYFANSNYEKMVGNLRERIGNSEASVLLYYTEFCDPKVRQAWSDKGFFIECSGFAWGAENRTLWTYNGGRPRFLQNTLRVLLAHGEVICTSPTTLATYSASLGIPTSLWIDDEISFSLDLVNEGKGVERLRAYDSRIREIAKNLLGPDFEIRDISREKRQLSLKYLGVESFQSQDSLRRLLPLEANLIPVPLPSY